MWLNEFSLTIAPADFTARQNFPVVFSGNQNTRSVEVFLQNDVLFEDDETFEGRLSLPSGSVGVVLGLDSATATIVDDDGEDGM